MAIQVLVKVYAPEHAPAVIAFEYVMTGLLHPSVAVAIPRVAVVVSPGQSIVAFTGQVITGAVMSCTTII